MDDQQKVILLLTLVCATVFFFTRAHAQEPLAMEQPDVVPVVTTVVPPSSQVADAMHQIRLAVRQLEQAALQRDFASNADEIDLLQLAHDKLVTAMKELCCEEREQAAHLASDIEHVLVRDSTYLGPLISPADERFGPPAPTRDQLAQLVQEGQELVRGAPVINRLIDSDVFSLSSRTLPVAPARVNENPIGPTYTDSFYLPPDTNAATTQFHFRF